LGNRLLHLVHANTRAGSRRNIQAHYDLGNDFYARWLDAGMTYSSALYPCTDLTLEEAQTAKQDRVLELLAPSAGQTVLEIGMGWGGLAERLAQEGCQVTGLTLSPSQLQHASGRLQGLAVQPHLRDYRDEAGRYDRIVSIEMLEAVGEVYWPTYFNKVRQCLATGGNAVLQVITIADHRFAQYRATPDFIQRYIFPGGMLPSPRVIREQATAAGLKITAHQTFSLDYARTLAEWLRRFEMAWPDIAVMGFPARFRRLWHYYLCYCEAGFRSGVLDVGLWRLEHED
jgi:cyclopropane-fatty-acyl-phospholipid synthase